jgi:hypothetical protein
LWEWGRKHEREKDKTKLLNCRENGRESLLEDILHNCAKRPDILELSVSGKMH